MSTTQVSVLARARRSWRGKRDQVVTRGHAWVWSSVVPHVLHSMWIAPVDGTEFLCQLRYSDMIKLDEHEVVRQAREAGAGNLAVLPPAHWMPLLGQLLSSDTKLDARGVQLECYLRTLLHAGGAVRAHTLTVLRGLQ